MRLCFFIFISMLFASITNAQTRLVDPAFAPENYPGRMPATETAKHQPLVKQFLAAMQARDARKIESLKRQIIAAMGKYAGIPESPPNYARVELSRPDFGRIEAVWLDYFDRMKGRNGWAQAVTTSREGKAQPRLRVSFRQARSYFHSSEAKIKNASTFLRNAIDGSDYMLSQQTSIGVFGYPYDPQAKSGLTSQALRIVREGEARGMKMTDGKWIIDDLNDGGLQFDNGEVGFGLLHAYALTGEKKYLESAKRAGDWAIKRPLVFNFNYNGFSGGLLARLYRMTGESKYLVAAKNKFVFGVMPGQMANGRWFDQHNASIQYHALMMRQLIEFYLALEQAEDPLADAVRRSILVGLDNMAEEDMTYGVTIGKASESLNIEAYTFGLMVFGHRKNWETAADLSINYLTKAYVPEAVKRDAPLPETIASYLLYRRVDEGKAESCEVDLEKCLSRLRK